MPLKVLILGANGYIGSSLTRAILKQKDWEVYGMDIGSHKLEDSLGHPRFKFVEGDVTINREYIDYHVKKCDAVIPLVDIANPFTEDFTDFTLDETTSAAEVLAATVPGARVVGALKNTFWVVLQDPEFPEGESDILVTGDDPDAKALVMGVLHPLPFRVLDAGPLRNSRTIERMTLLSREIALTYGHYPRTTWRLLGQDARGAN